MAIKDTRRYVVDEVRLSKGRIDVDLYTSSDADAPMPSIWLPEQLMVSGGDTSPLLHVRPGDRFALTLMSLPDPRARQRWDEKEEHKRQYHAQLRQSDQWLSWTVHGVGDERLIEALLAADLSPNQLSGLAPGRILDFHIQDQQTGEDITEEQATTIATALFRHRNGREPTPEDWAPFGMPDVESGGAMR